MEFENFFEPFMKDRFRLCRGTGYATEGESVMCNKKLCFYSPDRQLLAEVLYKLMQRDDAWAAKYSTYTKGGMHLGRAFFTNEETVGRLWQGFKSHPDLFCAVQDDDWSERFREADPIIVL